MTIRTRENSPSPGCPVRVVRCVVLLLAFSTVPLAAQPSTPWLVVSRMPTTLAPVADFSRDFRARTTELERLLFAPSASAYWQLGVSALLLGAPAATHHFEASSSLGRESGGFRRSLEPPSTQRVGVAVGGWQHLSSDAMVVGTARVEQATFARGGLFDDDAPYGSSAFALADTSGSTLARTGAQLAGAGAWQLGALTVGADAAYETWQRNSSNSGFARLARGVLESASLSVRADRVPLVHPYLLLGWRGGAETRRMVEVGAQGVRFELFGLADVPFQVLDGGFYYNRMEDDEPLGAAGFESGALAWHVAGEWRHARRQQTLLIEGNPVRNRWTPTSDQGSFLARWSPAGRPWEFQAVARHSRLLGTALRAGDTTGAVFSAAEQRTVVGISAIGTPADAWRLGGGAALERFARQRANTAPDRVLDFTTTTLLWDGWAERNVSAQFSLLARFTLSSSRTDGTRTKYLTEGAAYSRFLLPDFALEGRDASDVGAMIRATWRLRNGSEGWVSFATSSASPQGTSTLGALAASGSRTSTALTVGFSRDVH